jgi:Ca2+-binding EF-hand superfamily protein
MGIASCFHLCTAMYQTPDVFGIKALMIPAYIICIVLRWWTTIDLLLNPTCYYKIMREYICLSIYTWCRLYFVVFFTMRIFEHNRYTISIVLAGFTCAPSCGPAFNLGIAMFAFGYLILVGFCFGEENKAWQLTETSGSMFKNPTFRGFLMAAKTMQVAEHHADESESDTPQTRIARLLFQQFDKDKSGMLDYYEMSTLGATFGSGVLHDKVESYLKRHPASAHDGLDFEAFRKLLFPGQGFFVDLDTYDAAARSERSQAKLIFDGITVVGGTDYVTVEEMQSLFIEWGVPRREAMRMFVMADKDGSGEIDFEEFFKYMKPVWKYQFKELRGTLAEFEHIEHRKKVLKAFEHSKIPVKAKKAHRESAATAAATAEIAALKAQIAAVTGGGGTPATPKAAPAVSPKPMTTPGGTHQSSEI